MLAHDSMLQSSNYFIRAIPASRKIAMFVNELVPEEGIEPSRGVNPTGF